MNTTNCICCGKMDHVFLKYVPMAHYHNSTEKYRYFFCNACHVLWRSLSDPINLEQYNSDYYSFSTRITRVQNLKNKLSTFLFNLLFYHNVDFGNSRKYILDRVFNRLKIDKDAHILDVGCGSGEFLKKLSRYGYRNLIGIDPYLKNINSSLKIYNCNLADFSGQFDLINAHHVIEHTESPRGFIKSIYANLKPGGLAIITFPRFSKVLEYDGAFSYLLQAPDHNVMLSVDCFIDMIKDEGFLLNHYELDGTGTFKWLVMGELWKMGINKMNYSVDLLRFLSIKKIFHLKRIASKLNFANEAANVLCIIEKHS